MELGALLILLLVLACPLLMVFVHRSGHGGHAAHHGGDGGLRTGSDALPTAGSLDELRRARAELDTEIGRLERAASDAEPTTVA